MKGPAGSFLKTLVESISVAFAGVCLRACMSARASERAFVCVCVLFA